MSAQVLKRAGPIIMSFEEPRASGAGTNKDMRAFMVRNSFPLETRQKLILSCGVLQSSKVKNARRVIGIADIANAKKNGKSKPAEANNTEEEAYVISTSPSLSYSDTLSSF